LNIGRKKRKKEKRMSTDTLTTTSRAFFERAKLKLAASIVIAGTGLMVLGFTSAAAGQSASANDMSDAKDDNVKSSEKALAGGFGFAAFAYIIAFLLFVIAAIYVSPLICGSPNERKMINSPQEIDSSNYTAYTENPSAGSKV